jgi:hypothetical protein
VALDFLVVQHYQQHLVALDFLAYQLSRLLRWHLRYLYYLMRLEFLEHQQDLAVLMIQYYL